MLQVEFFFDFSCPWSYLACARLREAALRTGATIIWQPFDLADLRPMQGRAGSPLDADPVRGDWQLRDLHQWADYCALPLQLPADWPRAAPLALCGAAIAAGAGRADKFVPNTFRALYAEGRNIADAAVLHDIAAASDLEPAAFAASLAEPASAAILKTNAAKLQSRGGFRSATLYVGEQMFCGNSRMPLVEFALAQASGRQFVMPGQHSG